MALKILVDIDGVCADFASLYLRRLRNLTGRVHFLAEVTNWDFTKCVSSLREDQLVWESIAAHEGLVAGLRELPQALPTICRWRAAGHRVVAVTHPARRAPDWGYERTEWLLARGWAEDDIVLCKDKSLVPGDFLIDDSRANVQRWASVHPTGRGLLMQQPWAPEGYTWDQIKEIVG